MSLAQVSVCLRISQIVEVGIFVSFEISLRGILSFLEAVIIVRVFKLIS